MALNSHSRSLYLILSKSAAVHAIGKVLSELTSRLGSIEFFISGPLAQFLKQLEKDDHRTIRSRPQCSAKEIRFMSQA